MKSQESRIVKWIDLLTSRNLAANAKCQKLIFESSGYSQHPKSRAVYLEVMDEISVIEKTIQRRQMRLKRLGSKLAGLRTGQLI